MMTLHIAIHRLLEVRDSLEESLANGESLQADLKSCRKKTVQGEAQYKEKIEELEKVRK